MSVARGFSLLELIIYMAILSIMSVIMTGSFLSLARGRAQADSRTEVNANVRFAMEKIEQDIRSASSVVTPVYGTASSTLQLMIAGATTTYAVSTGILQRTVGAGSPDRISGTTVVIDAPTFTRIENYNATLGATSTFIQTLITVRYYGASPDTTYSATVRTSTGLR